VSVVASISGEINAKAGRELLELIPGSDLLHSWYKKHGSAFDKMRDGPRIASLMKQEDIDPLFAKLMAELESL